jgi:hypothetical protein
MLVLAFLGIQKILRNRHLQLMIMCVSVLSAPFIFFGFGKAIKPEHSEAGNLEIALLLKNNSAAGTKIADSYAGTVFYFSERYGIDLLGKSDRYIARLQTSHGTRPGHNKFDFDYSLGKRKPDFVVSMLKHPVNPKEIHSKARAQLPFIGMLYRNRFFHTHCFPHPVPVVTWRTIYVCDWSDQKDSVDRWQKLP